MIIIDNVEELKSDNYSLSTRLNEALSKINNLTTSLDTANQELTEAKSLVSAKQSETAGNEQAISTLQKQLGDKTKQLERVKQEMGQEVTTLKTKIAWFEKENAEFSVKMFNAEKGQSKAEESLKAKQAELNELERSHKAKIEILENRLGN